MTNTASVRDLRDRLADVIDRAAHADEATIITRRGRAVAAVVPIETLREHERWDDERLGAIVAARMADFDRADGVPIAEVIAETMARPE